MALTPLPVSMSSTRSGRPDLGQHGRRYTKIVAIAARHGLGRFVRAGARLGRSSEQGMTDTAVALRRALEDAGVAFVKLGQMLSTRRDLLPAALVEELTKLQAQAQPAPWSEIEPAIGTALGRPITELLHAIDRDDPIAATDALIELLGRPDELEQRGLERSVGELMVRYRGGTGGGGSAGLFATLFKLVLGHRFAVPAQVAAAFRAMGALEGTLSLVSPGFDLFGAARECGGNIMAAAVRPDAVRQTLEGQVASLVPILQRLPRRLNKITEDLAQGRFGVHVRVLADGRDREFVTGLAQQVMVTILAAAATIGAIMLITSDTGPMLTTSLRLYAFLGYALLFVGFVLGLRVLVQVFFRGLRE